MTTEDLAPQIQAKLAALKAGTAASTETAVSSQETGGKLLMDTELDAVCAGGGEPAATGGDVSKGGTAAPGSVPAEGEHVPPPKKRRQEVRRRGEPAPTAKSGSKTADVPGGRRGGAQKAGRDLN